MSERRYVQEAPFPEILNDLVLRLRYRPGWRFDLIEDLDRDTDEDDNVTSHGTTFVITTRGYDSYHPDRGETYGVRHYFPVPPATYDERSWRRWILDTLLKVESHEACEFFTLVTEGEFVQRDGTVVHEHIERPYAPSHGPGNDPYLIREIGTDLDVRTRFTGEVR